MESLAINNNLKTSFHSAGSSRIFPCLREMQLTQKPVQPLSGQHDFLGPNEALFVDS